MTNSILFDERYALRFQDILSKVAVGKAISNMRLEKIASFGQQIDRYKLDLSGIRVRDEVRTQTDRTADDVSMSKQYLTVNNGKYMGFHLHKWDIKQLGPHKLQLEAAKQNAISMKNYLDGDIFNEVQNAAQDLDDGDIGGSSGTPITMAINKLAEIVTEGAAKLRAYKVPEGNFAWVIDPKMTAVIEQYLMNKDTDLGDSAFKNGYVGKLLRKFDIYESNSLTYKNTFYLGANPTDGDTITLSQGGTTVTLTFKNTASVAGQVKIGESAALTLDNLVACIDASGTGDGTDYYEPSTAARKFLRDTIRADATDGTTYLGLECVGSGRVTVGGSLTDATNNYWGTGYIETYMGKKGGIDVVVQQDIEPDITTPAYRPKLKLVWVDMLYGKKTFDDGAAKFLNCKIATN